MKKVFETLKKEFINLGILFIIMIILFKVVFFKEQFLVSSRFVVSLFWLFVLPGYFIMLYWKEKLDFIERLVIGTALSVALIGIFSYYIGLIGLNIKFHSIILPLIFILAGVYFSYHRNPPNSGLSSKI